MKIGIITFWWTDENYGQILQCYALQQYLREQGHEPFLIRYDRRKDKNVWFKIESALNPVKLIKFFRGKLKKNSKKTQVMLENNRLRKFDNFREKNIKQSKQFYSSYLELRINPPKADCYIVGSDQVWNFPKMSLCGIRNPIHVYFLDFGTEDTKRISYSASWGKKKISKRFIKEIAPLLKRFNYVSVREESGLDICRKCGVPDAEFRCDPTLLLSASHYRELYQTEGIINTSKYVLIYRLSNPCDFNMKAIKRWAKEKNLEIVYVTANGLYDTEKKLYPTIQQWLSLIDHAEYVITNSFHCCVFSLIFEKKFGAVPLIKSAEEMNTRIETLFNLFHIEPRWFIGNFDIIEKPLNISKIKIPEFRIESIIAN